MFADPIIGVFSLLLPLATVGGYSLLRPPHKRGGVLDQSRSVAAQMRETSVTTDRFRDGQPEFTGWSLSTKITQAFSSLGLMVIVLSTVIWNLAREQGGAVEAALFVSAALGIIYFVGLQLSRSITVPLKEAAQVATGLMNGDLTMPIDTSGAGETGALLRALGGMQQSLRQIILEVRNSSAGINTASGEISSGSFDLSERTEKTAANLQETASSIEQLTSTVQHSADSAQQANQLASSAAEVAERGGSVVAQVVATMDEINNSSKKISEIIGVIDGIAFQTNILALNAAVEAARAGEQGRGFAVVASEVRALAQRSAQSAREIKALIGDSVGKVESGSQQVAAAGQTMGEIVDSVKRMTDIISEILVASSEQSVGISQVNHAVGQLDQLTQQNAALVEESASAANSLREQAARLTDVVQAFRIDNV